MLDHIGIGVTDFAKAKAFYDLALAPLGITKIMEVTVVETGAYEGAGYGSDRPFFWIGSAQKTTPVHIAFRAKDHDAVKAFHSGGLKSGGHDNGGAGPRADYSPTYYAAFLIDPDGNNVEAVCT